MIGCLLCASAVLVHASAPLGDVWCGTDGGALPDLWQQTVIELEALEEVPKADAWGFAPGRVNVLLNKFALLHRGSVKQGPQTMKAVRGAMDALGKLRPQLVDAATATNVSSFTQSVAQVRSLMDELYGKYLPGSLKLGIAAINPALMLPASPTLIVKATAPVAVSSSVV